jgi:GrpB-like predicted nucleotidyltransferase (UPF0157 family)
VTERPPEPVVIVDYDPAWPARFEKERAAIATAFGGAMEGVAAIEHVGSTAIPGCAAKPVIDIMIGVRSLADGLRCITPIVRFGYECMGEAGLPGRIYFRKGAPRTHHIHFVEHECDFWVRHLLFRDTLRARPDLVEQYSALKRGLAATFGHDRIGYTEAKSPFIESALARARRGA